MRYLRMYIVINVLMTGIMCASEALPGDGISAGVDEEPPQETQNIPAIPPAQLAAEAGESAPVAEIAAENSTKADALQQENQPIAAKEAATPADNLKPEAQSAEAQEKVEVQAPVDAEPTIEEVEAFVALEQAVAQVPEPSQMPGSSIQGAVGGLPDAPQSHETSAPALEGDEPARGGIDTVDLVQPRGNWMFKRHWWDRAEETYKKIRGYVDKINDIRVKLFARRTELDKVILDPFYADIGLSQSDLQKSMQTLMTQLEQEREKQGMLSEEERELMGTIQKDRERLEKLDRDVRAVGALRDKADEAVDRVMAQKNRASQYEQEAWETRREIGRIVSDTQASKLFYEMDAASRTVKDIYKYIDQDLNQYFDQLLSNAREQTESIKTALQALKEQGLDLKARVQEAQEHDLARDLAVTEEDKDKKPVEPKKGWFASGSRLFQAAIDVALWQFLQSIWDVIMWLPRRIYGTITSIFR